MMTTILISLLGITVFGIGYILYQGHRLDKEHKKLMEEMDDKPGTFKY